ncbi:MAG: BtpA/SgcQ family protein [Phycisphaerales bacterium]|nr:BtpA/SgcQ family protein [Phycisphaerales bacterium]
MGRASVVARALGRDRALVGMVHVPALPGSPASRMTLRAIRAHVAAEAGVLAKAGFDAVLIENMHDAPYTTVHHPAVVAGMTAAGLAARDAAPDLPLGVQVLAAGNREALAVALACGGAFVRCENFVFAHVADEGLMPTAEAGELLRYRRSIGAEGVAVFADLKKKHASHAITADVSLAEACHAAEFFRADGVIVTGAHTGDPASEEDLGTARRACGGRLPVLVGSGATPENVGAMLRVADGVIVGSSLKRGGHWTGPLDAKRCAAVVKAADRAR